MIRQKLEVEIDWNIRKVDKKLFDYVAETLLDETLKSFTGIYQAKVTSGNKVRLSIFKPSAQKKSSEVKTKNIIGTEAQGFSVVDGKTYVGKSASSFIPKMSNSKGGFNGPPTTPPPGPPAAMSPRKRV